MLISLSKLHKTVIIHAAHSDPKGCDHVTREVIRLAKQYKIRCYLCGQIKTAPEFDDSGTELCEPCYTREGLRNEHSDHGHDKPVANCPECEEA